MGFNSAFKWLKFLQIKIILSKPQSLNITCISHSNFVSVEGFKVTEGLFEVEFNAEKIKLKLKL